MISHSPQPTHPNTEKKMGKGTVSSTAMFVEVPMSSFDKTPTIGTRKALDVSAHTLSQELPNGSSVNTTVTAFWSFGDAASVMEPDAEDETRNWYANSNVNDNDNESGFNWSQTEPVSRANFESDINVDDDNDDNDDNDSCPCSSVSVVSNNAPKEESVAQQLPQSELGSQQETQAICGAHQEAVTQFHSSSEEDNDEQPVVAEKEVVGGNEKARTIQKSKKKPKKLCSKEATSGEEREEEQPSTGPITDSITATKRLPKKVFNWIQPDLSSIPEANESDRTGVRSSSCSLLDEYSLPPKTKSSGLRQKGRCSYLKGRRSTDSTARRSLISSVLQQLDA